MNKEKHGETNNKANFKDRIIKAGTATGVFSVACILAKNEPKLFLGVTTVVLAGGFIYSGVTGKPVDIGLGDFGFKLGTAIGE
jgi:hypothetical protein